MKKIILASKSPRRKELLEQIGLEFKIDVSRVNEDNFPHSLPINLVKLLSKTKAEVVAKRYEDVVIISADTVVVLEKEIIGKPKSLKDAVKMLKKLSNKTHSVITGFTVLDTKTKKTITKTEKTEVTFRKLTETEVKRYVYSSKVLDKAGAYAIQDKAGMFVEKIKGDYFNIVGLPIFSLSQVLKEFDIDISENW